MRYFKTLLIAVVFVLAGLGTAQAQKTGYVNSDQLIAYMPESVQVQQQLAAFKKVLDGEIQEKINVYQQNLAAAQQKVANELLTPIQKSELEKAIKAEEDEIVAFEQKQAERYTKRTTDLFNPILEKINTAISEVAESNGYQMILDTKTNLIIYSDGTGDITRLVGEKLGIKFDQN